MKKVLCLVGLVVCMICLVSAQEVKQDTVYTVQWVVVSVVPAPCPQRAVTDEYGITSSPMMSCTVLHTKTERDIRTRDFATEKEADNFIKNQPVRMNWELGSHCENFEKIKKIREKTNKVK